ncbi:MAG TPA: hypothetical protein VFQ77_18925 [Pseudonocardiaceae bacterium]|jgi:hypothetical protein|nr:hypothetical protein [Pseudonocardiaceae bacterium]
MNIHALFPGAVRTTPDHPPSTQIPELNAMLLHEVLARTRMHEDQHRATQMRLASRLATARRWQRLARYAERQAHRAAARL